MEEAKACSKCGEVKSLSEFQRTKDGFLGRRADCKSCQAQYKHQRWISGQTSARRRSDPVSTQLYMMNANAKRRARSKGLPYDIDIDYLRSIAPSRCPLLGVELQWACNSGLSSEGGPSSNSPSLDRIDSSKGYVKGNVVIVSHRANTIKNDATEDELLRIGRALSILKAKSALQGDANMHIRKN